jgi:hypothetical protein
VDIKIKRKAVCANADCFAKVIHFEREREGNQDDIELSI